MNRASLTVAVKSLFPAILMWWLLAAVFLLPTTPGAWADSASQDLDPVVADVIEMLQSQVDEGVVLKWLESTGRRPGDIGSQGVIALTEAGASENLITQLLEWVAPRQASAPTGGDQASAVDLEQLETEATTPIASSTEQTEATIRLWAKRVWVDEDEPDQPRDPPWWVYLYLDGELVDWTRPTTRGEPVVARRDIESGRRELRVVLQRYEELRGGWQYESLAVPTLVSFEARDDEPIEIEVGMTRIWGLWRQRQDGGPLSYVIRQGQRVLAEHEGTGGDPNRWHPVCEDVEANFPDSEGVPKRFLNSMSRCLRWSELWTGPGRSTDRTEILSRLAEYDFQPPVR